MVSGAARVHANATLLRRALVNLVQNAICYTPAGGNVRVEAATAPEGQAVTLTVTDTGTGIAPALIPRLCERHVQGAMRASGSTGAGLGLGLAIVRSIAKLHGGGVSIESREGEGTRVTLRLPLSASAVCVDIAQL